MERFVNSGSALTELSFKLKRMRAKGIHLRYTGTNQAGQTLANSNLGIWLLQYAARPRINLSAVQGALLNDYHYGLNYRSSSAGAAFDMNYYIPFSNPLNPLDNNVVDLTDDDYITIPAVSSTVVSSITCAVYIDEDDAGDTLYRPSIYTRSQTLTAEAPIFLPDKNIYYLLGAEPATPPTKIILAKGALNSDSTNKFLKFDVPYAVAEITTLREGRLEPSATFDAFVLNMGSVNSCLGKDYELQMVGGSGTFTYTVFSLDMIRQIRHTVIDNDGNISVVAAPISARVPAQGGGTVAVSRSAIRGPVPNPRPNFAVDSVAISSS
jgi:hypothetical protein